MRFRAQVQDYSCSCGVLPECAGAESKESEGFAQFKCYKLECLVIYRVPQQENVNSVIW